VVRDEEGWEVLDFSEVAKELTPEQAVAEAKRCLQCRTAPCMRGCPVAVKIPAFIRLIADGDFAGARRKIEETNLLGAVCGRVCPQELQCQKGCVRGVRGEPITIGRLERFAAGCGEAALKADSHTMRVAVVGSGPAGLACAGELAKKGVAVVIFEALHTIGGVLKYGIPEFRLPDAVLRRIEDEIVSLGVKIKTNTLVGRTISIEELLRDFDAVFVGTGAGLPNFLGISGEGLNGVYSANEFLARINLMGAGIDEHADTPILAGKSVAVIGGGNVAMDAARCALRLAGTERVRLVYRRTRDEMPARKEEVEHAQSEGVELLELASPVRVLGDIDGRVRGLEIIHTEQGGTDANGRKSFKEIANSEEVIKVDSVIIAIGQSPNPVFSRSVKGLEVNKRGGIVIDESANLGGETSIANVYAGGDAVTGAATVILAMGAGRECAYKIIENYEKRRAAEV
jgi:glutamate synthase (NADPH/NADH) small chain